MQDEALKETLQSMRIGCRKAMNGIISTSMRTRGLHYKMNFGLTIQQIKSLAAEYTPNRNLAQKLWAEDTRELKILATLLYPPLQLTIEVANEWARSIPNQEIREQVCMQLFQHSQEANELAETWAKNSEEGLRTTGYWLLARLFLTKKTTKIELTDSFPFIWQDILATDIFLRNAALLILKQIGRQSKEMADTILEQLSIYKGDTDLIKREVYTSLAFEFQYFFED